MGLSLWMSLSEYHLTHSHNDSGRRDVLPRLTGEETELRKRSEMSQVTQPAMVESGFEPRSAGSQGSVCPVLSRTA